MSDPVQNEITPAAARPSRDLDPVIGRRLDALERENRRLKRLGMFTLVAVGVFLGLAAALIAVSARRGAPGTVADALDARRFVLRGSNGEIRGVLGVAEDGAARFILQDANGQERIRLTVLPDGSPGMAFSDSANHSRAVLGLLPDESVSLVLADRKGNTRTVLTLGGDESSTLVFADRFGTTRTGLGIDARGTAMLTLPGAEERAEPDTETVPDTAPGPRSNGKQR